MKPTTKPRALILDDNTETLELLREATRKMPFETVLVDRGIDALIQIFRGYRQKRPFDAIVLDCATPYFDGFTIAKMVRTAEQTGITQRRAKIGFFTAYPETVERSTLLQEVKADAYWRKPDDVVELPYLIASWLEVEVDGGKEPK